VATPKQRKDKTALKQKSKEEELTSAKVGMNEVIIEGIAYKKLPIGYNKACIHRASTYTKCNDFNLKPGHTRTPKYYELKYKYSTTVPEVYDLRLRK